MNAPAKQTPPSGARGRKLALVIATAPLITGAASIQFAQAQDINEGPRDPGFTKGTNPGALPPQSLPYGHTYGEWAALWWQWALGIPESMNPVEDTTGQFAGVGQQGPVWFLGGTFGNSVERGITVPRGKAIFMPVNQ